MGYIPGREPMIFRPYGKTGKRLSAIGFGAMRFPTPMSPRNYGDAVDLVLYAHAKGINYFDTAPFYCDDRSEEIVGEALQQVKPGTFCVSTKSLAPTGDELRRHIEKALQRLRVGRIHFFHIWCLLRPDEWERRKRAGVLEAARRARDEGLIEHIVFSTHMSGDEAAAVIREGVFEGVTLGYSAIDFPYRRRAVEAAGAAGIGVVTMNPLGGGLIPRHADRFDFIRGPADADVVTAALRFNLSHPAVTCALVGFSERRHVDAAIAALEGFTPHDAAFVSNLEKRIEAGFEYLCTGCGYCLPCPKDVPIPRFMDAYNMLILGERKEAVPSRLKWQWALQASQAGRCDACGQCETSCTQHLPIIQRLRELKDL